jgi:hypothetical protein
MPQTEIENDLELALLSHQYRRRSLKPIQYRTATRAEIQR